MSLEELLYTVWGGGVGPFRRIVKVPSRILYLFGGPYIQDYSILGSILGSPDVAKLPYDVVACQIMPDHLLIQPPLTYSPLPSYLKKLDLM